MTKTKTSRPTIMTSVVNIICSLDGSNIKDDVVKRIKEGNDGIDDVRTFCLDDRLGVDNPKASANVNILIITPCMCMEISRKSDKDFRVLFPDIEKSLLLVCDTRSENKVADICKKSVEYSKITQFHNSNAMEWKFMLVPTIKKMASQEKEEPIIPEVNRYVIRPKLIDSCVDEVCLIFLEDIGHHQHVKVAVDDKAVVATGLSRGVYVFCPQDLSPGPHTITVLVGEEDYGSTILEVQTDIEKLQAIFHRTLQKDVFTLLSILLGSHSKDKEDIEREMIDILSEKPFNPAFLNLMERLLRLEPNDAKTANEESEEFCYPSLLHFCAANGLSSVCQWILYNNADDKRRWQNKEGLTPAQLAARGNYEHLQKLLDPEKPIAGPPLGQRERFSFNLDDDAVFLSSPVSPGMRRPSVPSEPGRDSGQFSSSDGSAGCSAASVKPSRRQSADSINITGGFSKKERLYDKIDDDKLTENQTRQSAPLPNKKFSFKKKEHHYNDIDDLKLDTEVHLRPTKDPPYDEAWDKNPIPDMPFKQPSNQQRRGSERATLTRTGTFPKGSIQKSASLPRGKSLDEVASGTYL